MSVNHEGIAKPGLRRPASDRLMSSHHAGSNPAPLAIENGIRASHGPKAYIITSQVFEGSEKAFTFSIGSCEWMALL